MSELKLTGRIIAIEEMQQVTDSFCKREFVIETDENYPQLVKFEFTQDKCSTLDTEQVGNEVTVNFNVRGRAWENKQGKTVYFVTLQAWRLESVQGNTQPAKVGSEPAVDDLPF